MGKEIQMQFKRVIAILLVIVSFQMLLIPSVAASSNNFTLSASKSGYLDSSKITNSFSSTVTGGGGVTGYSAKFKGTAKGSWASGKTCKISYTLSFKMTGAGSLSISGSGPSLTVSGSTASKTITESGIKGFNWGYNLTFKRWNICWVTQTLASTFSFKKSGTNYSQSINCSADRVFW